MGEDKAEKEPALVERWLHDQQQWQRTILTYLDSMVKNDDFLVHLGNAMRGSLLAGKPYPTAAPAAPATETPVDQRLDQVLFAINQLQGQLQDVLMTLDEIRKERAVPPATVTQDVAEPAKGGKPARVRAVAPSSPGKARARRIRG